MAKLTDEQIIAKGMSIPTKPNLEGDAKKDHITQICFDLLMASQTYKQPRMNTLIMYEAMYRNAIPPKFRQMFNVPLPVFSGMIDTLLADFNDQIQIRYNSLNPAQDLVVPKIQAHWEAERDSLTPNANWNYKARTDRYNATISGRGILKNFATSDPEYENFLEVVNYSDFHCQPYGGGQLENHLFAGQEGIFKTISDLKSPYYEQKQVEKLSTFAYSDKFSQDLNNTYGDRLVRFKALNLDVDTNSVTGSKTYNLCEFIITYEDGERWYCLFEPCSRIWLRCCPWKEICPSGAYPWVSWATHEDHKNFWSKSYADDLYYPADAIITMYNQELTNREKKNFNARAYDRAMFPDVGKLDQAQYRMDALVPVNTGGVRKIADGIYEFQTAELKGTVDLINFTISIVQSFVGVNPLSMGTPAEHAKPSVVVSQQQQMAKRIGYRADSFKEAYSRLGMLYLEGLKEHMPPKVSVRILGENGFIDTADLKRIELKDLGDIGISVTSSSEQENIDNMKRDSRVKAIDMVAKNPNLTDLEKETIYRDVGQFDEADIQLLLSSKSYTSRKQIAQASKAIQQILNGKEPSIYHGADMSYLDYMMNFITDNEEKIKDKEKKFQDLITTMGPIISQNMMLIAKKQGINKIQDQQNPQQSQPQPQPQPPTPSPMSMAQKQGNINK